MNISDTLPKDRARSRQERKKPTKDERELIVSKDKIPLSARSGEGDKKSKGRDKDVIAIDLCAPNDSYFIQSRTDEAPVVPFAKLDLKFSIKTEPEVKSAPIADPKSLKKRASTPDSAKLQKPGVTSSQPPREGHQKAASSKESKKQTEAPTQTPPVTSANATQKLSKSEPELFDRNTSQIMNMIHLLQSELSDLDKAFLTSLTDIKKEQGYFEEYNSDLVALAAKKNDLNKSIKETQDWLAISTESVKSFQQNYTTLFSEIGKIQNLPEISHNR